MENCVFCKIISGEFSSRKIYEDDKTLAFLDISKDVDGHILVVPKKHVKNILDADEETLSHVMSTVKKISNHYIDKCGYSGVNILNNNNESAEQSIMHLHFHIIPKKDTDSFKIFPNLHEGKKELEEMYKLLKI